MFYWKFVSQTTTARPAGREKQLQDCLVTVHFYKGRNFLAMAGYQKSILNDLGFPIRYHNISGWQAASFGGRLLPTNPAVPERQFGKHWGKEDQSIIIGCTVVLFSLFIVYEELLQSWINLSLPLCQQSCFQTFQLRRRWATVHTPSITLLGSIHQFC